MQTPVDTTTYEEVMKHARRLARKLSYDQDTEFSTETMSYSEALQFATKVARRMTRDPEGESIAGVIAWKAVDSFVPGPYRSIRRHIARSVKIAVYDYWKKCARKPAAYSAHQVDSEAFWNAITVEMPTEGDIPLPQPEWQLLCEKYIDRWPYDVIARRHGVTEYRVRHMIKEALARFEECVRNGSGVPELT